MENSSCSSDPIAIIGMSCRYPHSNSPEEFWQLLAEGRDGVGPVPPDRLEKGIISSGYKYNPANYLTLAIDEFDARFFEVSPKTAKFMDPQLRLLLEVAWEGLEDASVNPENIRGTQTGIFVGSWLQDYRNIGMLSPEKDFFLVYMGHSMAARMAHFLGTVGPAMDTESACSSSMAAVHLACQSLKNKSTNLAIVGGVNLMIDSGNELDLGFATCSDGRCKSFSDEANGYGRAEGCGVLILKRLSTAVRDGDRILALIRGSAVTQEGLSKSMGTPTVHSEALAMSLALKDAGVDPFDVSYIEAHGTGTPVGDPIEISAIEKVYSSKSRNAPLIIGTVKTNVGHSEACSGITGIIKVVLAMQNEMIPKHLHFKACNAGINLEEIPAQLPLEPVKWPSVPGGKPRIAGVSSFGISGTDVHVIIQEYPVDNKQVIDDKLNMERPLHIMTLSAKTEEALEMLTGKYCKYLKNTDNKLEDIAYTANTGRAFFDHRLVVIAGDNAEALGKLAKENFQSRIPNSTGVKPKICMLFPGQGSQYPEMAKEIYEQSPIFKQHFDECCQLLLEEAVKIDLKSILWGNEINTLNKSINGQVAIFCIDYCLFKLWERWGVRPDYVLGHSLGESAAVVAVGVRDLRTGLRAMLLKCQLLDKLDHGRMIAVRGAQDKVKELIEDFGSSFKSKNYWLDIAAVNSPEQTVLAGETECVEKFHQYCMEKGVKSTIIASSHAFHSRMLDPAMNDIQHGIAAIRQLSSTPPSTGENGGTLNTKYISSSEAKLMEYDELHEEEYWVANTRNTVQFMDACKVAFNEGCRIFIEVGAQPILSALVKANYSANPGEGPVLCLPSLRKNENNWETLLNSLAQLSVTSRGDEINWREFDKPYLRRKVSLPHYPFIKKSYWIDRNEILSVDLGNASASPSVESGHPLLGFQMDIASDDIHVFENSISLAQEGLEYLVDHCIGNYVIFPGAGFLEMALAAVNYSKYCGTGEEGWKPISLENFKIVNPLELEIGRSCRLQVMMRTTQSAQHEIKVSHFKNMSSDAPEGGNWVDHSVTITNAITPNKTTPPRVVITKFLEQDWIPIISNEIIQLYHDDLPKIGLRFGECFQTIHNAWRNPIDSDNIMIELKIKSSVIQQSKNYQIHPMIADGMVQSTLLLLPKNILHVPVGIERFTLFREVYSYGKFFVNCKRSGVDEKGESFNVELLDEENVLVAKMEGLKMRATTVNKIEKRLDSYQKNGHSLPKFWKEEWRPSSLSKMIAPNIGQLSRQPDTNNRWLLIGSNRELSEKIQKCLNQTVENGAIALADFMNDDQLHSKDALFKLLDNRVASIEGILYLNGLCQKEESQENICLQFLFICQWLQVNYHLPQVQSLQVAVVTQGLHLVEESDETFNPAPATLGGMLNTLKNECPKLVTKWFDLSHKPSWNDQVPIICREILDVDGWKDGQVAIRGGQRYVIKFVGVPVPNVKNKLRKQDPLFKHRCSTYMVTGGLSGLGLQVASWMLENGARCMILVGRTKPKPEVSKTIQEWRENGKRVYVFNADVGYWNECSALFDWIQDTELPPLRGIVHCAGVLADASISNQTWTSFEKVFGPKVNGSWNLHTLSLYYQLDYFIMFSSFSSLFGIPGQINYAAGNSYEDALIRYRHSLGLPGTTINWANWEEIGMASNVQFPGVKPISIQQGLDALEYILREKIRQITVANFYSFPDFARLCPRSIGYVDDKLMENKSSPSEPARFAKPRKETLPNGKTMFMEELDQAGERYEKSLVIQKYIEISLQDLLKMNHSDRIGEHVEFHTLGIDSLMMMELQSKLQEIFGERLLITGNHLADFPTKKGLADKLLELLNK